MKTKFFVTFALTLAASLPAADKSTLLFEDHFERNESQETTDEIGNGWTSNSKARAGGHKQVDLRNGAMYIVKHATADHAVSVPHDAAFKNGTVAMRFMLENEKDTLGIDFADSDFKEVWAGHLFKVDVSPKRIDISDSKLGTMNMKFRELRLAKKLTPEQEKFIASKKKGFPHPLETGKWYQLLIEVVNDTVTVSIDGKVIGSFTSEGFAHPTKKMIRLGVNREAVIDDVKVMALR